MRLTSVAAWLGAVLLAASSAWVLAADTPETLVERYAAQATAADPAFAGFSAERGRAF
jgi:hypothetical protein